MARDRGKSRTRRRRPGEDPKTFFLLLEGAKTEKEYFEGTKPKSRKVRVLCFGSRHKSSPRNILRKAERILKKLDKEYPIEIWIVIDRDNWDPADLDKLGRWARQGGGICFLALSNPNFEYWLLLHFEDAGRLSAKECVRRLRKYLPGGGKGVDARRITPELIALAIKRGKERDSPPCEGWPRDLGSTTVYRLVERIWAAA